MSILITKKEVITQGLKLTPSRHLLTFKQKILEETYEKTFLLLFAIVLLDYILSKGYKKYKNILNILI